MLPASQMPAGSLLVWIVLEYAPPRLAVVIVRRVLDWTTRKRAHFDLQVLQHGVELLARAGIAAFGEARLP